MHLYSTLFYIAVHTKRFTIMGGGGGGDLSSTTTSVRKYSKASSQLPKLLFLLAISWKLPASENQVASCYTMETSRNTMKLEQHIGNQLQHNGKKSQHYEISKTQRKQALTKQNQLNTTKTSCNTIKLAQHIRNKLQRNRNKPQHYEISTAKGKQATTQRNYHNTILQFIVLWRFCCFVHYWATIHLSLEMCLQFLKLLRQ